MGATPYITALEDHAHAAYRSRDHARLAAAHTLLAREHTSRGSDRSVINSHEASEFAASQMHLRAGGTHADMDRHMDSISRDLDARRLSRTPASSTFVDPTTNARTTVLHPSVVAARAEHGLRHGTPSGTATGHEHHVAEAARHAKLAKSWASDARKATRSGHASVAASADAQAAHHRAKAAEHQSHADAIKRDDHGRFARK